MVWNVTISITIDEIADRKSVSRSTVKRKKELIKQLWEEKMPS